MNVIKKTPVRPLVEQRDLLMSRVERFYKSKDRSKKHYKRMWKNIAQELNQIGPPKEVCQWKKLWSDAILKTRKKIRNSNGAPIRFSENDLRIIDIFGGEDNLMCIYNRGYIDDKGNSEESKFFETISLDDSRDEFDVSDGNKISGESYDKTHIDYSNNTDLDEIPECKSDLSKIHPYKPPMASIEEDPIDIIHIDKKPIIITKNERSANTHEIPSEIKDFENSFNNEMLEIQKDTLNEIRQISKAQMETNNLLRILINKLK